MGTPLVFLIICCNVMNVWDRLGISFVHYIFMKHILMIKLYSVSLCLLPMCEGVVVDIFWLNDL